MKTLIIYIVSLFILLTGLIACAEADPTPFPPTAVPEEAAVMPEPTEEAAQEPTAVPTPAEEPTAEPTAEPVAEETAVLTTLSTDITDQSWQWISFTDPVSGTQSIPEPEKYQLTLNEDGTFDMQLDCNIGSGAYTVEDSNIALIIDAVTDADCPSDSVADTLLENLETTALYFMQDGDLFLELLYDSGVMQFTAVTAAAADDTPADNTENISTESEEENGGNNEITPQSIRMDTQGLANSWAWQVMSNRPGVSSYILLTFDDREADSDTVLANDIPHIAIFPTESYIAAGGKNIEAEIARLQALIDGEKAADPMPLLPLADSFMGQWAQYAPLNFSEGDGVRYVSERTDRQENGAWVNEGTAYYYEGLTEDGRFYISLVWPVRTDSLPDTADDVSEETRNAATESDDTYEAYLIATQNRLNILPSSAWEPNLDDLDALINSLTLYE